MSHSNEFWNFGNADRSEDTPKGYFTPLFPHNLGRPLHHPEQDCIVSIFSRPQSTQLGFSPNHDLR